MSAIATFLGSELKIATRFYFYGTYAEDKLSQKIVREINEMWNKPQAKMELEGTLYHITFNIDFVSVPNEEVASTFFHKNDYGNIFIRLEGGNVLERSMMGQGLGENSGHWIVTDNLGESTTAPHEFGHALGLPHPQLADFRGMGIPPIMAPRGTLVDSQFQWNPLAEPGDYGGTLKPIYRQVQAWEVAEVVQHIRPSNGSIHRIGKLSNTLYNYIGQPVNILLS